MEIKGSVLERLARLYFSLRRGDICEDCEWISSAIIAEHFDMDDTQIRKDLAVIGVKGRPRMGFKRQEVIDEVGGVLGLNKPNKSVVIGAGRLGGAISEYPGFKKYGVTISALFDNDPNKIGSVIGSCAVYSMDMLENEIRSNNIKLAVLTCPSSVAQEATNRLVKVGIKAIWNFSPKKIMVPEDVIVRNEHISVGLAGLTYHLNK